MQLLKLRSNCDGQIFISFIFSFVIFSFRKVSIFFRLVVASGLNFLRRKTEQEALIFELVTGPAKSSFIDEECVDKKCAVIDTHICVNPSGKLVSDQGSQTIYLKYELSAKVESMVLRKDVFTTARYHYSIQIMAIT